MVVRILILSACLLTGTAALRRASRNEVVPLREPLASFPSQVAGWSSAGSFDFDQKILDVLGADDYLNRIYVRRDGVGVEFYIGYYESQRQGDTMHSPLNCMPGAGWSFAQRSYASIPVERSEQGAAGQNLSSSIRPNRIVIAKGLDRRLVLYWYQSRGRVVASEYWAKVHTVLDALRLNRTDAALVRIMTPITGSDPASELAAEERLTEFVQSTFKILCRLLPA